MRVKHHDKPLLPFKFGRWMTEGVSGGNLTNLIYEDMLPNQIKNAHFLPVGEPMPDGIKILENSVFRVFFVDIHEPSCELVDLFF